MLEDASRIPDGLKLPSLRTHCATANGKCRRCGVPPLPGEGVAGPGREWGGSSEEDRSTKESSA